MSVFKKGSSVPVKFRLTGIAGNPAGDAAAVIALGDNPLFSEYGRVRIGLLCAPAFADMA